MRPSPRNRNRVVFGWSTGMCNEFAGNSEDLVSKTAGADWSW